MSIHNSGLSYGTVALYTQEEATFDSEQIETTPYIPESSPLLTLLQLQTT